MTLGDSPTGPLAQVLAVARSLEAEDVVAELVALADRLQEGRFYVACVGQFKRGKSTLLNALLGACVLPVGVTPVTAVVTVVRYGPAPGARVRMHGTWTDIPLDALAEFVAEERNPENAKQVEAVEVFAPSRLLETGMCLVDTPARHEQPARRERSPRPGSREPAGRRAGDPAASAGGCRGRRTRARASEFLARAQDRLGAGSP
jgi:hypothetical protein